MTSGDRLRLSLRGLVAGEAFGLSRISSAGEVAVGSPLPMAGGELTTAALELAGRLARSSVTGTAEVSRGARFVALGPALGAFFAEDEAALWQAAESITPFSEPDLLAGTIALALGAAWAARYAEHAGATERAISDDRRRFLVWIRDRLPEGAVRSRLERAVQTPLEGAPRAAAAHLGATDPAPGVAELVAFVLWCAARHLEDFSSALLATEALDTAEAHEAAVVDHLAADRGVVACAAAGGIVAISAGEASIPSAWLAGAPALPLEVVALP